MNNRHAGDVAIVGSGIIGVTTALELQSRGWRVALIDPEEPGFGTAAGSASFIAEGQIFPIARASVVRGLPRILFDPLGPLVVRPEYAPSLFGWGLRFLGSLRPARFKEITRALASLNRRALAALFDLAARADAESLLTQQGVLVICGDARGLAELKLDLPTLDSYGIAAELVSQARLHELEPALSEAFAGAIFFPRAAHCRDVTEFGRRLTARIVEGGGSVYRGRVDWLSPEADGSWQLVLEDGGRLYSRSVVVSAGVWSKPILEKLGYTVPIETERGYHLMLPHCGVKLNRPIVFNDRHFAATPLLSGLRLAGTVEFAGISAPMNPRRSDVLFDLAAPFLPGLRREGATRWMGFRPTFPDSLPVIGRAPRHRNLYCNFGHQHLGLTQSAISARCLADVMTGREPEIDMGPFCLERFSQNGCCAATNM